MEARGRLLGFAISALAWLTAAPQPVPATTITVGQGGGYDHATIQAAIDAATTGDTVLVHPGTYVENIHLKGKNIILRSTNPTDPATVAATIIDGNSSGSVVTFAGSETSSCVLSGFTITNGTTDSNGGGVCGNGTLTTIQNNAISSNTAHNGGGALHACDGPIENNTITGNSARSGGGLRACLGTIQDNVIASNTANLGGGLFDCDGTIQGNIIGSNLAVFPYAEGGGLRACDGAIQNNTIASNEANEGGGLYACYGTIQNNIITNNVARKSGGGIFDCGMIQNNTITSNSAVSGGGLLECRETIRNCVIWGNLPAMRQLERCEPPSYSCIQNWIGGGNGNITSDPLFVSADTGDYRLQRGSPCVDTGTNSYWWLWPQRDLDGNCRLAGERVDMGCYEYGSSTDTDGDLLSDAYELTTGTDRFAADTDRDGLRDGLEILRGSDALNVTGPHVVHVPRDISSIQEALAVSVSGDEIIVSPGLYSGLLQFSGPDVTLRSEAPEDLAWVAVTVLDGGFGAPVLSFHGTESEACILAGFTIQKAGGARQGGGIRGNGTLATIRFNRIQNNYASQGGGLAYCDGTIENNTIRLNSTRGNGGGLYRCNGTIRNNTISGNWARLDSGGLFGCNGAICNNLVEGNSAGGEGGGLAYCDGNIENNTIRGNSAHSGGGLYGCDGTIENNIISGNSARFGGGLSGCDGTIQYNNITENSVDYRGGGLYNCNGTIRNTIIWQNDAPTDAQLRYCSLPSYSCIQGWTEGGEGNISYDPLFTTGPLGAHYLSQIAAGQAVQSPCVDAGSTSAFAAGLGDSTTRMDGGADEGVVDMGYHYPIVQIADLRGILSEIDPRPIIKEGPIVFSGSVKNQALVAANQPVWVEFWAINSQTGWTGYLCDSVLLGPMGAGEVFDLGAIDPVRAVYDSVPGGVYTIEMRIDATGAVKEWYEANNVVRLEGVVILPDRPNLVATGLDFSPQEVSPEGGTAMTFSGAIRNIGTQPTTGPFWVEFRVWPGDPERTASRYLCDSLLVVGAVEAGGSVSLFNGTNRTYRTYTSYALPEGAYTVGVRIDPLDEIAEQREDDNVVWLAHKKLYVGLRPTGVQERAWRLYR